MSNTKKVGIVVTAVAIAMIASMFTACAPEQQQSTESSSAAVEKTKADASKLEKSIKEAEKALEKADPESEGYKALQKEIDKAKKLAADESATQSDLDIEASAIDKMAGKLPKKAEGESAQSAEAVKDTGTEAVETATDAVETPSGDEPQGSCYAESGQQSQQPASGGSSGGGSASAARQQPSSGGSSQGGGSASSGSGSAEAQQPAPQPEKQKVWVDEQGHWEHVQVQAAWDEEIDNPEPILGCSVCGSTDISRAHLKQCGGCVATVGVQHNVSYVHHDAVYEDQWVVDVPGHWE